MRAARVPIFAALAVALLVVLPTAPAQAWGPGYGQATQITGWSYGTISAIRGTTCVISVGAGVQEFGQNHVTRLKIKFELRGQNDSTSWAPTYRTVGYFYSNYFPDDPRSFYYTAGTNLNVAIGGKYSMWAVVVGERGWRRDFKTRVALGTVGCDATQLYDDQTGDGGGTIHLHPGA